MALQCNGSVTLTDSLHWWLHRNGLAIRFCYRSEINPDLIGKYTLDIVAYGYILTIRDLSVDDAGTYICTRNISDRITFLVNVTDMATTQTFTLSATNIAGNVSLLPPPMRL